MQINMCNLLKTLVKESTGSGSSNQLSGKNEEIVNEDNGLFMSFFQAISSESSVPEDFGKDKAWVKTEEQPEIIAGLLPVDVEDRNMILPENNLTDQKIMPVESYSQDEPVNMAKDFEKTDIAVPPQSFKTGEDNKIEDFRVDQKSNINSDAEGKKEDNGTNPNSRIGTETKPESNDKHNIDIKNRPDTPVLRSETRASLEDKNYGSDLKRMQNSFIKQDLSVKQDLPLKQDFSVKNDVIPWQEDGAEGRGDNIANPKSVFSIEDEDRPEASNSSNSDNVKAPAVLSSQFKEEMHTQQRAANANVSNPELNQETKVRVINQIVEHVSFFKAGKLDAVRIQLKPESLGQLKLEILTENKQVMLKIVTEHHAVRSVIEENLGQLKADLRDNGLEINRCEVLVGDEADKGHGQSFARFFMADVFKKTEGNNRNLAENDDSDVKPVADGHGTSVITENGVDCFV